MRESAPPGNHLTETGAYEPEDSSSGDEIHPSLIGDYRIIRMLGAGGMGRVFEAEPLNGGPRVAVKILSSRLMANPVSVERFRQEGRLAAQIAHPRCVFVLGADADRGQPYIVMELMPGDTLKDLIDREGALPPARAIQLTLDVIEGLLEAHRLGVVHRDIKPSNCFLMPDGRVKIGDFGLSKSLGSDAQLTQSGAFLGTILYASPEQIRGEPVDFASDVYSLGATLFHLLTGRAPFQHENPTAVLAKIISEDPPSVRDLNGDVPADLALVVQRSLERDKSRRYASLTEMKAALVALIPEQLTFGGMGVRIGAYLIDEVIVRLFLLGPMQLMMREDDEVLWFGEAATWVVFFAYFMILEGFFGRSIGKAILRLRVCRQGTTMAPGFRPAVLRTLVFSCLFTLTFAQIPLGLEKLSEGRPLSSLLWNLLPFGAGLSILLVPMRTRNDFRGLHELLSRTCVMRLPHRPVEFKLRPGRVDRLGEIPRRPVKFPEMIGSYAITRAMRSGEDWLALGEDSMLGRAILLQLTPPDRPERNPPTGRPGRLWSLGSGRVAVGGESFVWRAFVAPVGSPLADAVDPREPVRWPEARPVLEQLAHELLLAEKDDTLPAPLSLEQVWVQTDGHLQLLEFPLKPATNLTSVELAIQASAVLLEGAPRPAKDRRDIAAPLPRHAAKMLGRLNQSRNERAALGRLAEEIKASRFFPTRVSRLLRLFQLGMLGFLSLLPWLALFGVAAFYNLVIALEEPSFRESQTNIALARDLLYFPDEARNDPVKADPVFRKALEDRLSIETARVREMTPGMTVPENLAVIGIFSSQFNDSPPALVSRGQKMLSTEVAPSLRIHRRWGGFVRSFLIWPLIPAFFAFMSKGVIIRILFGLGTMRSDGSPARRYQHALKAFLFWLPVSVMLSMVIWLRAKHPEAELLWQLLWLGTAGVIPAGMGFALVNPERSPLDRMARTWLVPG